MFRPFEKPSDATPKSRQKQGGRQQTEKSRMLILLARQAKRFRGGPSQEIDKSDSDSYQSYLQRWFFTSSFSNVQRQDDLHKESDRKSFQQDRCRSVYSLLKSLVTTVQGLLSQHSGQREVVHILNTTVVDDTSTRMRGPSDATSIFTVMNSIQNLHVKYQGAETFCSMRLPTPLLCLEAADTQGIYQNLIGGTMVTSHGIGTLWERLGLDKQAIDNCPGWKTLVFLGDSLKTNDAAFQQELLELRKTKKKQHLAIRLRCYIHQTCLIRRPAVLAVPRLWTTIVRLSHLFEVLSFRKKIAQALATVVCNSFTYIPVRKMPPESSAWRAQSNQLEQSYNPTGKRRKEHAKEILTFLNGNYESDAVFHYCLHNTDPPCCSSYEESLNKALAKIIPFFAKGCPVPLLYRFKFYSDASGFITMGVVLHRLLVRALASMSDLPSGSSDRGDQQTDFINKLLGQADLSTADVDGTVCFDDGFVEEENFQAKNAKRKRLVHQEVVKPEFIQSVKIVDAVINPMDGMINKLFRHCEDLSKLTLLGTHDEQFQKTATSTKELFMSVVRGDYGRMIIQQYSDMLSHGLNRLLDLNIQPSSVDHWQTLFTVIIHLVTDVWRRFVHSHDALPFELFSMLGADLENFIEQWDTFHKSKRYCAKCFDFAFSKNLLDAYPSHLAAEPLTTQQSVFDDVTRLLGDIAQYSPLSSASVEVKNGQIQCIASGSTRGIKAPLGARETALLSQCIRGFELQKHWVEQVTLPSKKKRSGILKRCGKLGVNQFSKALGKESKSKQVSRPISFLSQSRITTAANRKLRRISAWNVFQRERLQSMEGILSPQQFKDAVAKLSKEWASLPEDEKEAYTSQAQYEESKRREVMSTPLASSTCKASPVEESKVSRSALKKLSVARLSHNFMDYENHPMWKGPCQMGNGALKQSLIDTATSDQECHNFLGSALHARIGLDAVESDDESDIDMDATDLKTCHSQFGGLCQQDPHCDDAVKLVRIFNKAIQEYNVKIGNLLLFSAASDSFVGFLGCCLKRPTLHTFLQAGMSSTSDEVFLVDHLSQMGFLTSHQLFPRLAATPEEPTVLVQVWDYTVQVRGHGLVIHSLQVDREFTLDPTSKRAARKRATGKLPFGLEMPAKKKTTSTKKLKRKAKAKGSVQKSAKETDDSDASSSSSSSSSNSANKPSQDVIPPESETCVPISEAAQVEEQKGNSLLSKHSFLMESVDQTQDAVRCAQVASSSTSAGNEVPNPSSSSGKNAKTFFSKEVGVDSVGIAVSSRSVCNFCKGKIIKGTIRVSWHHSLLKPSVWVHKDCLRHLILRDGFLCQAKRKLQELKGQWRPSHEIGAALASLLSSLDSL
eukprot:Skav232834  [mRNA]  locus=scaffold2600:228035:233309:- [translate_table: standard]